jgi:hypothetical protein
MKNRETERTVVTLGNGVDLVAQIAKKVVGEEVADMYDGAPLSNEVMHRLATVKFKSHLADHVEN